MAKDTKDTGIKRIPYITQSALGKACGRSRQYIDFLCLAGRLDFVHTVNELKLIPCPDLPSLISQVKGCKERKRRKKAAAQA